MRLVPRSLSARLVLGAAVFILLALVATGLAVQFALHRFVQGQIDQRLDGQVMTVASALRPQPDGTLRLDRNVDGPPFDAPHTGWFWVARSPTQNWRSQAADARPELRPNEPFDRPPPREPPHRSGDLRTRSQRYIIGTQDVLIAASAPVEALNGPMRDALVPLLTALLVLGGGLIAATALQVRLGLRPLQRLQGLLAQVRAGRLDRLPADQPREIGPLVTELNSLLDQNAANLERARRHVANLAHGLKTPLATLALALDHPGSSGDTDPRALVSIIDRRIRHHLARAQAAALGAPARSRLALAPRVADHVAAFSKLYADKSVACATGITDDLCVACDAQDLDEMLGNLLDNAFKWTAGRIAIVAEITQGRIAVAIDDDGPGLTAAEIGHVLKPGQRLDERAPGHGFGLSIAQELAELYGGGLVLGASPLGGLRAALTLPAGA